MQIVNPSGKGSVYISITDPTSAFRGDNGRKQKTRNMTVRGATGPELFDAIHGMLTIMSNRGISCANAVALFADAAGRATNRKGKK